jgi:sec-independent protein translocase protein TatA
MVAYSPGPEWIVVLVVVVLIFGAKKLPELARSVGKSTSEFKKGMSEGSSDTDEAEAEAGTNDAGEPRAERKAETTE